MGRYFGFMKEDSGVNGMEYRRKSVTEQVSQATAIFPTMDVDA
jgi:hypothetical protein